jgi:hypothetical protein
LFFWGLKSFFEFTVDVLQGKIFRIIIPHPVKDLEITAIIEPNHSGATGFPMVKKRRMLVKEVNAMPTVKAYYDGSTFFPIGVLNIPKGRVVNLTINEEENVNPEIAKKLAQLVTINSRLEKLNETEPLPPELDEILAQRVNFSRKLDL